MCIRDSYDTVTEAARSAGAYGACLSGAGPSILVFYPSGNRAFANLLTEELTKIPGGWRPVFTRIDSRGAYME